MPAFLDTCFGEGMRSIWREVSAVKVDGKPVDVARRITRQQPGKKESVFMIPAQRVLRDCEFATTGPLFPQNNRLKSDYRTLLCSARANSAVAKAVANSRARHSPSAFTTLSATAGATHPAPSPHRPDAPTIAG